MTTELDKLYGLIDEIEIAMMTTRRPDGHLESRAMANQKPASGADLWFVTSEGTQKLSDLEKIRMSTWPLPGRIARVDLRLRYRDNLSRPQQDPRALRARLEGVVPRGGGSSSRNAGRPATGVNRRRRARGRVPRSQ